MTRTHAAYQLLRHSACPHSPWNGFSTGNADTLHVPGVRQALLAFHAAHYCARRMRAVVVGPQPTSVLAGLASAAFSGIPPLCASTPRNVFISYSFLVDLFGFNPKLCNLR